jgi:hypothetical protein
MQPTATTNRTAVKAKCFFRIVPPKTNDVDILFQPGGSLSPG